MAPSNLLGIMCGCGQPIVVINTPKHGRVELHASPICRTFQRAQEKHHGGAVCSFTLQFVALIKRPAGSQVTELKPARIVQKGRGRLQAEAALAAPVGNDGCPEGEAW